jgi:hypothetical protein
MRKILKAVKDDYMGTPEQHYFESIEETLNLLEDRSMLYSGQGEEDWAKGINKLTNNFAVAVLGMNVPVMLKQTVSYITAMEVIDSKYLKMAGFGSKMYPIMNPKGIFEALKFSKLNEGKSILPIEWNLDTTVGNYALMRKYSPALTARLDGFISRELGEALMNQDTNDDLNTAYEFKKILNENNILDRIEKIHINTPVRPSGFKEVFVPNLNNIQLFKDILGKKAETINQTRDNQFISDYIEKNKDIYKRILELAKRRPVTIRELSHSFGLNINEIIKCVKYLLADAKIKYKVYRNTRYYYC